MDKYLEHTSLYWSHNGSDLVTVYVIERSADGVNFKAIGATGSHGGTAEENYDGYDLEPMVGDNYYRIAMHRIDGNTAYSEVKKVVYNTVDDYQLFPNPANGFVNINLETVIGKQADIQILNSFGLKMKEFNLGEVYSKYYQMDIRDLHEGHYIVWINVPGKRPIAKQLAIGRI